MDVSPAAIAVVAIGASPDEARLAPLRAAVRVEVHSVESRDAAAINRAVDEAACDWILILDRGEAVPAALATEIRQYVVGLPRAWGARIGSRFRYAGRLLAFRRPGMIRLYHRRRGRLRNGEDEVRVQGTVVRFREALLVDLFASPREHRLQLSEIAHPHSRLRQILLFLSRVLRSPGAWPSAVTLRYLWEESRFDLACRPAGGPPTQPLDRD